MNMITAIRLLLSLLVTGMLLLQPVNTAAAKADKSDVSDVFSIKGDFDEVKEDLVRAIEGKGIVVSYIAHASSMLNRTAETLKIKKQVYHKAEIILFCKSEISHRLVQVDPHNLILCPYPVAIYSLSAQPDMIYLAIRKPPVNVPAYAVVHEMLLEIIKETIEF